MPVQYTLFADLNKQQVFLDDVDPNTCVIDPFNSRKTRLSEDAGKLASRMLQYGYDKTRAVWVRRNEDDVLSVFAGGTRLDAAKKAGLMVAVILHDGYTDEEIAWLTELDNESDEYHVPVGPVDTWAEYARLYDKEEGEGWTVEQIARAKNDSDRMVYHRLKLHTLPNHIKEFCTQGLLTETHLREIIQIELEYNFTSWLTTEQAWEELAGHWRDARPSRRKIFAQGSWLFPIHRGSPQHQEKRPRSHRKDRERNTIMTQQRDAFLQSLMRRLVHAERELDIALKIGSDPYSEVQKFKEIQKTIREYKYYKELEKGIQS